MTDNTAFSLMPLRNLVPVFSHLYHTRIKAFCNIAHALYKHLDIQMWVWYMRMLVI
jgi:hypothetical protein